MTSRRVLMMVEVTAVWGRMREFNERWETQNLPYWQAGGARYLGSYTNHLGADSNSTIRLFEFDDLDACQRFLGERQAMFESERGTQSIASVQESVEKIRETIWLRTTTDG